MDKLKLWDLQYDVGELAVLAPVMYQFPWQLYKALFRQHTCMQNMHEYYSNDIILHTVIT